MRHHYFVLIGWRHAILEDKDSPAINESSLLIYLRALQEGKLCSASDAESLVYIIFTMLKAFADYVDSLCGTPYPMDYEILLRRLRRNIHEEHHG